MERLIDSGTALSSLAVTALLLTAAMPLAAALPPSEPPTAPDVPAGPPAVEPPVPSLDAVTAANAAALALLNGDVTTARAHALAAFEAVYGAATASPAVIEAYAHQFAFIQNPVANPGFEIATPANELGVGGWFGRELAIEADAAAGSAVLVIPESRDAIQFYAATTGDVDDLSPAGVPDTAPVLESSDAGATLSPFWAPDSVSLLANGTGTMTVTLAEAAQGRTWLATMDVSSPEWQRLRFDVLASAPLVTEGETTFVTFTDGSREEAALVLANSALRSVELDAGVGGLRVDDVVVDGVAYGPNPNLAIHLDDRAVNARAADLLFGDASPLAAIEENPDLQVHDGYAVLVLPLDFAPTLLAGGPEGVAENASAYAVQGDWTFFVTAVEFAPSGARFAAPTGGFLSIVDAGPAGPGQRREHFDGVAPVSLAAQGTTGALLADVLAAQGLAGPVLGAAVAVEDVLVTEATVILAQVKLDPYYDYNTGFYFGNGYSSLGFFNYAKLLQPGRAVGDLLDAKPQSLYAGRQAVTAAFYAAERRTDANDGYLPVVRPVHYQPAADGNLPQHVTVLANGSGDYHFELSFLDYRPGPTAGTVVTDGTRPVLALFEPSVANDVLTGNAADWLDYAVLRACDDADYETDFCDVGIEALGGGAYAVAIPALDLSTATDGGNGGAFAVLAYLDVGSGDPELGTASSRGAFSLAANALVDRAEEFALPGPLSAVGPHWVYQAADVASVAPSPVVLAPITDLTDRHAVIIEPVGETGENGALLPDVYGNYTFDVKVFEYGYDGRVLRPVVSGVENFTFRLLNLSEAAANPVGAVSSFVFEAEERHVTTRLDGYTIKVPAYEIPHAVAPPATPEAPEGAPEVPEAPALPALPAEAPAVAPPALQALTAWASLEIETNPAVPTPGADPSNAVSGYYSLVKNEAQDHAAADQLDYAVSPFHLDRAVETYGLEWSAPIGDVDTGRYAPATLEFDLVNTGAFWERFLLTLDADSELEVAIESVGVEAPTDAGSADALVPPGGTATVRVRALPLNEAQNEVPYDVDLAAALDHPVAPGAGTVTGAVAGTVTVSPLAFTVEPVPGFDAAPLPGVANFMEFHLNNSPTGVNETFTTAAAPAVGDEDFASMVSSVPTTGDLKGGDQQIVRVDYTLHEGSDDGTPAFGSVHTVRLTATPTHGGTAITASDFVQVPESTLTIAAKAPTALLLRNGELATFEFFLNYSGPYVEAFDVSASHETRAFDGAAIALAVDGTPVTDSFTLDGTGGDVSRTLTVSYTVPMDVAFNSTDVVSVDVASKDPRSTITDLMAQGSVRVKTARLLVEPDTVVDYVLQGETASRTVTLRYEGQFDSSFDLRPVGDLFGEAATVTPATLDFVGGGFGVYDARTVTIEAVVPIGVDYGESDVVTLNATPSTIWNTAYPVEADVTAAVFNLTPTVALAADEVATFPEDVPAVYDFDVSLAAFTGDELTQWEERTGTTVTFALDAAHANESAWFDALDATVTLAPGDTKALTFRATGNTTFDDDAFTLKATAQGLPKALAASDAATTRIYTAEDFVVQTVLVGCYGASAAECERVAGPVQALTTHDLPEASYSRAYALTTLINVKDAASPAYYDLAGTDAAATVVVSSEPVDGGLAGAALALADASAHAGDGAFAALSGGAGLVTLPAGAAVEPPAGEAGAAGAPEGNAASRQAPTNGLVSLRSPVVAAQPPCTLSGLDFATFAGCLQRAGGDLVSAVGIYAMCPDSPPAVLACVTSVRDAVLTGTPPPPPQPDTDAILAYAPSQQDVEALAAPLVDAAPSVEDVQGLVPTTPTLPPEGTPTPPTEDDVEALLAPVVSALPTPPALPPDGLPAPPTEEQIRDLVPDLPVTPPTLPPDGLPAPPTQQDVEALLDSVPAPAIPPEGAPTPDQLAEMLPDVPPAGVPPEGVPTAPSLEEVQEQLPPLPPDGVPPALPALPDGVALSQHSGVPVLLWETSDEEPVNVDWFLEHLGAGFIEATLKVHGLQMESFEYNPTQAVFPLSPLASVPAPFTVLTDKDDPDGDGYWAVGELRGGSNPLLFTSTPYSDDDGDGFANSQDLVPFLDEACIIEDIGDEGDLPCGVSDVAGGVTARLGFVEAVWHTLEVIARLGS